ncbi:MAG: LysR family transcriptional regulator [Geminicoccaceae bacterium]|nr:LysR family transcriptional regulator [Geminicoccaceae bacterium]MCS7266940.1 LysR family transcriptional regulator [Geminicoccaceae bacterium]MCX7629684.1 LysR family transcriptional regulator [Geminicoccaceae bacterium]MDW8123438.1 LysR family transcriptional regulator [Geminicoccaceae bacterium]MDW8341762.1 LysR family transcriptional regulator [Geminicoccaceae bacterium]
MDRLELLEAFLAVAEAGSFTGGAARLGVARALVSKRIAALERLLGARLIARTTRRVGLTPEGSALLVRARRILGDYREAVEELALSRGEPCGRLRLSAPMSFAVRHLGPVLAAFAQRFPKLGLEVVLADRFVDLIEENFDLALRIGDLPDSSLIARQLAPVRIVACAAPAYLERYGAPREPADLARHRCLHYGYLSTGRRWRLERAGRLECVTVGDELVANNGDLLAAVAEAGAGIALLPTFIVGDALRSGRLVRVLEGWETPRIALYAVWPPGGRPPIRVRVLVDFLAGRFGDPPYWDEGI